MVRSSCSAPTSDIPPSTGPAISGLALIVAPILVGGFGAAFELGILRRLYGRDGHAFLMVTFGLTLIMGEVIRLVWGVEALQVKPPDSLSDIVFILDEPFPGGPAVPRRFRNRRRLGHLGNSWRGPASAC